MAAAAIAAPVSAAMFAVAVNPGNNTPVLLVCAALLGVVAQALEVEKWRRHEACDLRLEQALIATLFQRSVSKREPSAVGAEMQALGNALVGYRLIYQHLVFTAPSVFLAAASASVLVASLGHALLAVVLFAYVPLYLAVAQWRSRRMARYARSVTAKRVEVARRFADALTNREIVRAFDAQTYVANNVERSARAATRMSQVLVELRAGASMLSVLIYGLALASILALAWYSGDGQADRVTLLVFASITLASLLRPLELAAQAFRDLILAMALVGPESAVKGPPSPTLKRSAEAATLALKSVSVAYGCGREVISDVTLFCAPGSVVGVRGDSGVGKSTIVRLITGELSPSRGDVLISGEMSPGSAAIAIAPQETFLLDASIRANICFGRRATEEELLRAVRMVGLDVVLARLHDGIETRVGERGARLSGGERQRVALARAVLKPAALYLFDEATSALDPRAERITMQNVIECLRGSTILIVAHRETALEWAESVVALRDGKLIVEPRPALSSSVSIG